MPSPAFLAGRLTNPHNAAFLAFKLFFTRYVLENPNESRPNLICQIKANNALTRLRSLGARRVEEEV